MKRILLLLATAVALSVSGFGVTRLALVAGDPNAASVPLSTPPGVSSAPLSTNGET